jgi:hypothetical protein
MIVNIDYRQFLLDLLPDPLLNSYSGMTVTVNKRERDWNYMMNSAVTYSSQWFDDYAADTYFKVYHNGQVESLEHYLNNEWLSTLGLPTGGISILPEYWTDIPRPSSECSIYIEDGAANENTYLFNEVETIPITEITYIFNESESGYETYIYNEPEVPLTSTDFIVYLQTVDYNNVAFRTLVTTAVQWYKPAGKTFAVIPY